jgi:membrane protease YdiL (CAAX protease family)
MNSSEDIVAANTRTIPVWARIILIFPVTMILGIPFFFFEIFFESTKGALPNEQAISLDLLLTSLFSSICITIGVYIFRRNLDRESFFSLGFDVRHIWRDLLYALITVLFIIGGGTFALLHLDAVQISYAGMGVGIFFINVLTFALVAFNEELLFRGYILSNLLGKMGRFWALTLSSVLFGLMHLGNNQIDWLPIINLILAGYLLGVTYIYTRNLWYPIFLHFFWNFIQGPILGYEVSGSQTISIFRMEAGSNVYLSGGLFGFEGSAACSILTLLFIVLIAAYYKRAQVKG